MLRAEDIDLSSFLQTWYGRPTREPAPLPSACGWLPDPLLAWHETTSTYERPLTYTTKYVAPQEIKVADDGMAVFLTDSLAEWRWAFDPSSPSTVFSAEIYEPWEQCREDIQLVLVHNAVREAVFGAPVRLRAFRLTEEQFNNVVRPLEAVDFDDWRWPAPGYRNFLGDSMLVEAVGSRTTGRWDVEVAGVSAASVSHLLEAGIDWRS